MKKLYCTIIGLIFLVGCSNEEHAFIKSRKFIKDYTKSHNTVCRVPLVSEDRFIKNGNEVICFHFYCTNDETPEYCTKV